MPKSLLPASAQPYAPRGSVHCVIDVNSNDTVSYLKSILKRVKPRKWHFRSNKDVVRCLEKMLAGPEKVWTLTTLELPEGPITDAIDRDEQRVEVHIKAYPVCVDMVSRHEIAFKLAPETIESLISYHREMYYSATLTKMAITSEGKAQALKLQQNFEYAVNGLIFRTKAKRALQSMGRDGTGTLRGHCAEQARRTIVRLFVPSKFPPPPDPSIGLPAATTIPRVLLPAVSGNPHAHFIQPRTSPSVEDPTLAISQRMQFHCGQVMAPGRWYYQAWDSGLSEQSLMDQYVPPECVFPPSVAALNGLAKGEEFGGASWMWSPPGHQYFTAT